MLASWEIANPDKASRAGTVPSRTRDIGRPSEPRRSSSKAAPVGFMGGPTLRPLTSCCVPPTSAWITNVRSSPAAATPPRNWPRNGWMVAMVFQVKMFRTWTVPRPGTPNTMYGATAGPASAAGSGPAGRHARGFQVPADDVTGRSPADPDEDEDEDEDVTGRPPAGRPVPGRLTMAPTAIAATAMVAVAAVAPLRIPRRRARLRRTRISGMGRSPIGRTKSASCSGSESSNIRHPLVKARELALQPVPGRGQPGPDRAGRDPAVACDVIHREIGQVVQHQDLALGERQPHQRDAQRRRLQRVVPVVPAGRAAALPHRQQRGHHPGPPHPPGRV